MMCFEERSKGERGGCRCPTGGCSRDKPQNTNERFGRITEATDMGVGKEGEIIWESGGQKASKPSEEGLEVSSEYKVVV